MKKCIGCSFVCTIMKFLDDVSLPYCVCNVNKDKLAYLVDAEKPSLMHFNYCIIYLGLNVRLYFCIVDSESFCVAKRHVTITCIIAISLSYEKTLIHFLVAVVIIAVVVPILCARIVPPHS